MARALGGGDVVVAAAALAVLLGHVCSVFLRFAGGKGVSTAFGACLALVPEAMILPLAVFALTFAAARIVSLASLAAAVTAPLAMALAGADRASVTMAGIAALVITLRHHDNLRRLRRGVEPRFEARRSPPGD
jgi:glycerol-3-phosphate acyltransferase PlsY